MLSHVQIVCFLASYSVALALEASRLWFRSNLRGMVMLGFVVAGWIAHTAYLYYSAVAAAQSPLSSNRDWLLLAAWVLVMVYFYLACYHPTTHFGIFLLPLVLGLIVAARYADAGRFPREPSRIWGVIHGTSILLATVTVLIGFAAGLMYLEQAHRLKRKRPPLLKLRLPSLEWLQTANSRTMLASMLLIGVAVVSGIVLKLLAKTPGVLWKDWVVFGTLLMFGWLLLHVVIGAFYRPIRQGRKVAYLTLVSFVFLVALVVMFATTKHGGGEERNAANTESRILHGRLPIANCRFEISSFKSQISSLKSQISNLRFQISNFEFRTSSAVVSLGKPAGGPS